MKSALTVQWIFRARRPNADGFLRNLEVNISRSPAFFICRAASRQATFSFGVSFFSPSHATLFFFFKKNIFSSAKFCLHSLIFKCSFSFQKSQTVLAVTKSTLTGNAYSGDSCQSPNNKWFFCFFFSKTHQCLLLILQSPSLLYPTLSPIPLSVRISRAVSSFLMTLLSSLSHLSLTA